MKATSLTYSKLHNLGNYSNERVDLTLEFEDGDRADDVLSKARMFVDRELGLSPHPRDIIARSNAAISKADAEIEKAEAKLEIVRKEPSDDTSADADEIRMHKTTIAHQEEIKRLANERIADTSENEDLLPF